MPERKYPGCVIQDDSLSILSGLARSIHERLAEDTDEELTGDVAELLKLLEDRQSHYEAVLAEHKIELSYVKRHSR
jgi:hypothetical protein